MDEPFGLSSGRQHAHRVVALGQSNDFLVLHNCNSLVLKFISATKIRYFFRICPVVALDKSLYLPFVHRVLVGIEADADLDHPLAVGEIRLCIATGINLVKSMACRVTHL